MIIASKLWICAFKSAELCARAGVANAKANPATNARPTSTAATLCVANVVLINYFIDLVTTHSFIIDECIVAFVLFRQKYKNFFGIFADARFLIIESWDSNEVAFRLEDVKISFH